jgi:hypothetical protein
MNRLVPLLAVFIFFNACIVTHVSAQDKGVKGLWNRAKRFAQGEKDSLLGRAGNKVNSKVDGILKPTPDQGQGSTGSTTNPPPSAGQPTNSPVNTTATATNSIIDESAFLNRISGGKKVAEGFSRLKIARNLALDVKGKYPIGYQPKWRFISYNSKLKFSKEDLAHPAYNSPPPSFDVSLGDNKGKAVLRIKMFSLCECFADIVISDTLAVIGSTPQTFQLTNFQKILNQMGTGEPCSSGFDDRYTGGGSQGQLTLSANENGDLVMNMVIENYSKEWKKRGKYNSAKKEWDYSVIPSSVSYRYTTNNITVDNEMSPEKVAAIIKAEDEAKQRRKDFLAKSKKQVDSLLALIPKKYAGTECRTCFSNNRDYSINPETHEYYYVNSGNYSHSETDYNLSTSLVVKNKCNYPITFVGIQQLYDSERGYYYVDVTKKMEANYEYEAQQGMFSYLFTSLMGANQDIYLQQEYSIQGATLNSVQWLKVIRMK